MQKKVILLATLLVLGAIPYIVTVAGESSTITNMIPDATVTAAIKSKFLADHEINGLNIHVETVNGNVTLTGKAPNASMITHAIDIAKDTNGVKSVTAKIDVVP